MTTYTAGWNMAGYLPETDPETFDTLEDAVAYLRETVDGWLDQDATSAVMGEGPMPDRTAADIVDDTGDGWYGNIHLWTEPTR